MRILALDVGRRRTGVAVSDPSGTIARPLETVSGAGMLERVVSLVERLAREAEPITEVVVGVPSRLTGEPSPFAREVMAFVRRLERQVSLPIVLVDERLTSHAADLLLGERERDWRVRKQKLDAAAAAVILQEYLDRRSAERVSTTRGFAAGGRQEDAEADQPDVWVATPERRRGRGRGRAR